jgi:exosome complex RNA-binding protein Rrp4
MQVDQRASSAENPDEAEVYPGKLLVPNTYEMLSGEGTYTYLGKIYAQIAG